MDAETNRVVAGLSLREHRLWRPDWAGGQAQLMWYLTFEAQHRVHDRVRDLQARLGGVPTLDLIPIDWLHCTLDSVGCLDTVPVDGVRAVAAAAALAVQGVRAPTLELGPVTPMEDSLVVPVEPNGELTRLRDLLCEATASVIVDHGAHDADDFEPHVSIGYVNTACQADALMGRFADVPDDELTVVPHSVVLASVTRRERYYDWTTTAFVALG